MQNHLDLGSTEYVKRKEIANTEENQMKIVARLWKYAYPFNCARRNIRICIGFWTLFFPFYRMHQINQNVVSEEQIAVLCTKNL